MSLLWKAREKKLMSDTFVLKGCWKRKEVVHPLIYKADVIKLANTHPWTINSTPEFKALYIKVYGQDEANILMVRGKPNMVEAFDPNWVQGGQKVESDPKPTPPEETLGPDDVWIDTGYGRVKGKKSAVLVPDLGQMPDLEALLDRVMVSVLRRAGLWKEIE
jgi:hypothetical protein